MYVDINCKSTFCIFFIIFLWHGISPALISSISSRFLRRSGSSEDGRRCCQQLQTLTLARSSLTFLQYSCIIISLPFPLSQPFPAKVAPSPVTSLQTSVSFTTDRSQSPLFLPENPSPGPLEDLSSDSTESTNFRVLVVFILFCVHQATFAP